MLELGPAGPLGARLDPVAVERAVEAVGADGRAVSHWAPAVAGSAVQGRAALTRPSIPFHTGGGEGGRRGGRKGGRRGREDNNFNMANTYK